jgi:adenosylhomocysteinase
MNSSSWDRKLSWVKSNTPQTTAAITRFPELKEVSLSVRFHLDLKMVPVIEALARKTHLQVFPCHEDTTDPDGWSYLQHHCAANLVSEWKPEFMAEHLRARPGYLCDLGGEMIVSALTSGVNVLAALEGTTSGVTRIQQTLDGGDSRFPIFDWNNARLKREIHNEKMVGFSLWQTFTEVTRLSLHGKRVTILGFGPVGRGIARTARSLGAQVQIFDPDPESVLTASFEGFSCPGRESALSQADVLVTATGAKGVLVLPDLAHLPQNALVLNAGHSADEIGLGIREHPNRSTILQHVEDITFSEGRKIRLLAQGRLLNLAAGFGDTINAFDITSAQLLDALAWTLRCHHRFGDGLHQIEKDFFRLSIS